MKKSLVVLLLAAASVAAQAQDTPAAQQQPAAGAAPPASQQRKEIRDPNEYNAYLAALNATDPAKKAQMMESYLQTYPSSVMKEDGLELLLVTYQQLNNTAQIKTVAQRLLEVNPNNLTALALLSYLDRQQALAGGSDAATALQEAGQLGSRGLQVLQTGAKPEGYTDEQWNSKKSSFREIFLGSVGHAALQAKDYATAQQDLKEVVALEPTDVNSIYLLALSYLSPKPPVVDGLFWIAKAAGGAPQLLPYAKNQYARYHGSEDGFDALMASAKTEATIPAGFTVTPAPSAADQAAGMLKKDSPEKLSFAEWQFILTNGSKDAVDQVWSAIKGKQVQLVAAVVEAGANSLKLAGSVDDIDAKKADITLNLKEPLAAARIPKAGDELTVQGVPSEFATGDNFNMVFADGEVLKGLPEAAAKKPAAGVHHKAAQ
jgi:tetratricopeptide (TPR) repeat protein